MCNSKESYPTAGMITVAIAITFSAVIGVYGMVTFVPPSKSLALGQLQGPRTYVYSADKGLVEITENKTYHVKDENGEFTRVNLLGKLQDGESKLPTVTDFDAIRFDEENCTYGTRETTKAIVDGTMVVMSRAMFREIIAELTKRSKSEP